MNGTTVIPSSSVSPFENYEKAFNSGNWEELSQNGWSFFVKASNSSTVSEFIIWFLKISMGKEMFA